MSIKKFFLIFTGVLVMCSAFANPNHKTATFAGGCFWCMEGPFEKLAGVKDIVAGYAGGKVANPSYQQVSSGKTGYVEAVQITYDPKVVSYKKLLEVYWRNIDPTDNYGQFSDRGSSYRAIIFYHDDTQKKQAEESKQKLAATNIFTKPIVTEIKKFTTFYRAEEYHQDYHRKNPIRYKFYRSRSGRDKFLKKVWHNKEFSLTKNNHHAYKIPTKEELKKILTPIQYHVTQKDGTEKPFTNEYDSNTREGIYVDIISGEPLFSSQDKYDSKTGWPSFAKPLEPNNIVEKVDYKFFMKRTEIRSKNANSHLGHVFNDGPKPTGLRYCINSAALKFIPKEDLKDKGYGEYLKLFAK